MTTRADLHIHTKASGDALNDPEAVFQAAERAGLAAISFTDHDSFGSIAAGRELAKKYPVKFMTGIELSTAWNGEYAHILAYFKNDPDIKFTKIISDSAHSGARSMAMPIINKMREMGYDISFEEYEKAAAKSAPGDSPLFRLTVKKGFARDLADYRRLFGDLWQEDAALAFPETREIIAAVYDAQGLAVLAHPGGSKKNRIFAFLARDIETLIESGLDGLEAYHELNNERTSALLLEIAKHHRMMVTGGSDSHGVKGARPIGSYTCDWEMFASGFEKRTEKNTFKCLKGTMSEIAEARKLIAR